MKSMAIIAIAFVLLIPIPIFASSYSQYVEQAMGESESVVTLSVYCSV
jgi:hypothetical protein